MNSKMRSERYVWMIKQLVFCSIMLFVFLYSMFTSNFAEWHISLPFLSFPIFVGEILLGICTLIVFLHPQIFPLESKILKTGVVVYLAWLLFRALTGYAQGGALAFRNAALFYYPFFALLTYLSYEPEYWKNKKVLSLLAVLLGALILAQKFSEYFALMYFACFILLVLAVFSGKSRWMVGLVIVGVIGSHLIFYGVLWNGSRSHVLSMLVAVIFLVGYSFGISSLKKLLKIFIIGVVVLGILGVVYKMGDKQSIKSMLTPKILLEVYQSCLEQIEKGRKTYVPQDIPVKTYHDNKVSVLVQKVDTPLEIRYRRYLLETITPEEFLPELSLAMTEYARELVASLERGSVKNKISHPMVVDEKTSEYFSLVRDRVKKVLQERHVYSFQAHDLDEALEPLKPFLARLVQNPDFKKVSSPALDKSLKLGEESLDRLTVEKKAQPKVFSEEYLQKFEDIAIFSLERFIAKKKEHAVMPEGKLPRSLANAYNNIIFRWLIWGDMLQELKEQRAIWGISFGKPQRSPSLEILEWGSTEWSRDGWITPHNSYLHMAYRAGMVGVLLVLFLAFVILRLIVKFGSARSWVGGILISALIYWMVMANFLVILELPYNAIPFWSWLGMTMVWAQRVVKSRPQEAS